MQNSGVLLFTRLRHCVEAVEQEDRNLLVGLPANMHGPVNTVGRILSVNLSRRSRLVAEECDDSYS
jgi:hypothetical protein